MHSASYRAPPADSAHTGGSLVAAIDAISVSEHLPHPRQATKCRGVTKRPSRNCSAVLLVVGAEPFAQDRLFKEYDEGIEAKCDNTSKEGGRSLRQPRQHERPRWHLIEVSFHCDKGEKNVAAFRSVRAELREQSYAIGE
jgi:hypothetical protein